MALSVLAVTGCSLRPADGEPATDTVAATADRTTPDRTTPDPTTPPREPCLSTTTEAEDRVVRFASLWEMAAAAEAVVVARATSDVQVHRLGEEPSVPFTTTRLEVVQTLHGELGQQTLRLVQVGDADECVQGDVVQPGRTYVVAVEPEVHDPAAPPTGLHVVSGNPAGLFELDPVDHQVRRLDEASPGLPAVTSLLEFRRLLSR